MWNINTIKYIYIAIYIEINKIYTKKIFKVKIYKREIYGKDI